MNPVLKGINLSLYPGNVMALIGGNGAGKSTLMKILMGIKRLDEGEIQINGEKVEINTPAAAIQHGVYYVPQEPSLFPNMTVEQNIFLGMKVNKQNREELKKRLSGLLKQLNWNLALDRNAESLSIAEQQLVEIIKGLMRDAQILILDEPTSALTFNEIKSLFKVIKNLREQNISIFYITHRLTEVFEIATHVMVLRDGQASVTGPVSDFTKEMLVQGLLPPQEKGAKQSEEVQEKKKIDYENLKPVLEIKNLSGYGFKDVNISVYPGEILGLAGIVGAGRTELAESIFGMDKILGGKVLLDGEDITGLKTKEVINKGLNYLPEDRHLNGIFGIADIKDNMTAGNLRWMSRFFTNKKQEKKLTGDYINDFKIKVTGQDQLISFLSGGNQQKVVIGKTLATSPKAVILDEPTRGIDAGARGDVYKIIRELKKAGHAVLIISSDIEEIVELSDRAVTMFRGTVNSEFKGDEIQLDSLMSASFGVVKKEVGDQ